MPRFNPWTNARFGFPRKDAPAFQREWMPMSSSGVAIAAANRTLIEPPSSVGVSGTIYLWGVSYVAAASTAHAGTITDDNGKEIITVVATQNGPYFLQLSTPSQTPQVSLERMVLHSRTPCVPRPPGRTCLYVRVRVPQTQ